MHIRQTEVAPLKLEGQLLVIQAQEMLTYRYDGRNFRLTDVHGHVVKEIIA